MVTVYPLPVLYGEDMSELPHLTKSQTMVLAVLRENGLDGITPKEILEKVTFAPRTVRYALRKLLKLQLVIRLPCLQDMRQHMYVPSED